jgi:hypothetical protein
MPAVAERLPWTRAGKPLETRPGVPAELAERHMPRLPRPTRSDHLRCCARAGSGRLIRTGGSGVQIPLPHQSLTSKRVIRRLLERTPIFGEWLAESAVLPIRNGYSVQRQQPLSANPERDPRSLSF